MTPYYQDDAVTIYHGDCREILPTLPKVDLVLTDPPYGASDTHAGHLSGVTLRDGSRARQELGFDGLDSSEMVGLARDWVESCSGWVVFTSEWKHLLPLDDAGLLIRFGIWRKPDGAPQFTGDRPGMGWEAVAICHGPGRKSWGGGGRHAFWEHAKGENRSGHPTGKPLGLLKEFVRDFSVAGDLILDPFAGSGTTGRAAKDLGRKAILIEIEEKYCEIAAKRMAQEVLL